MAFEDHFRDYLETREGFRIVTNPFGFIIYTLLEKDNYTYLYIKDIYIEPDHRKRHIAGNCANALVDKYKKHIAQVLGSVDINDPNCTINLQVLLNWGMRLSHRENDLLYFVKDV